MKTNKKSIIKRIVRTVVICTLIMAMLLPMCNTGMSAMIESDDDLCDPGGGSVCDPVVVSLAISPAGANLYAGYTQQFTATVTFSDGSTSDYSSKVVWRTSIGTISKSGKLTADETGTGTVTAIYDTAYDTKTITVTHGDLSTIKIATRVTPREHVSNITNSTIPFGLVGYDSNNNEFMISKANWILSEWMHSYDGQNWSTDTGHFANILQTGLFSLCSTTINGTSGNTTFNSSGALNFTGSVNLTANVGAGSAEIRINMSNNNDTITIDGAYVVTGESSASANGTPSKMAAQIIPHNNWNFGTVYPGTPTGWTDVTFLNIGTCDVIIVPTKPDIGIFQYIQFKDAADTIYDIGEFSIIVTITPLYNSKGYTVDFMSEEKTVQMRLNPPPDYVPGTENGSIAYCIAAA